MADLVNMQQTEYDEVLLKLSTLHTEELESFRKIIQNIKTLCAREGGFYVEKISLKVNMLLESAEAQVLAPLEQSFQASCEGMQAFMDAVKESDTV